MRILIAEDNETCSLMLSTMCKLYGSVTAVADGEALIRTFTTALVKNQPFDLVCLDIMMPGLDGQACLRCIRAVEHGFGRTGGAGIKIIMTTSIDARDSIMMAFRAQCEGYLIKPVNWQSLTEAFTKIGIPPVKVG
jgi:two-component system chemotaxis response regulator CheY